MRWVLFAITVVAVTVGAACYLGRPRRIHLTPPKAGAGQVREDLDLEGIHRTIEKLSGVDSRVTGRAGAEAAFTYLLDQVRKIPAAEVEVQDFRVVVPVTAEATLEVTSAGGAATIPLHPLWPNLARTPQTPPAGLTGPLIDAGVGTEDDLAGKKIAEAVVVMDWRADIDWLSVPEFGGKAVIFRGDRPSGGGLARGKFLSMPANIPRYYVAAEHVAKLNKLLAAQGARGVIRCRSDWEYAGAKNILARVSAGDGSRSGDDAAPIVFHAYYDSISVVPDRSPGAEQACGAAALLELGRYFAARPTARPVWVLFTGGHGQALAGMSHFVGRLRKGLTTEWAGWDEGALLRRMGRPGLFVGLDLSTRSEQFGLFCQGHYAEQHERILRHRFSALGEQLNKYARTFAGEADSDQTPSQNGFVDCINLTMGRGWWTYFPYRTAFESEIPTLAGFPGVTLATLNDARRYIDTPDDTAANLRRDLFDRQIAAEPGKRPGLSGIAEAILSWTGPFLSEALGDGWSRLDGRVVWLDQRKNYTPNEGLVKALVFLKAGRGDKYLMGTRGIPVAVTDARGRFSFDGLIRATQSGKYRQAVLESYGTATERFLEANPTAMAQYRQVLRRGGREDIAIEPDGQIVYAADMARPGDFPWQAATLLAEQHLNLVVFPCKAITLGGLTDPRGYIPLKDLSILDVATKSQPFQFGQSRSDMIEGDERENLVTLWADPTMRILLTLGLGFQEKRLILINNSLENPEGEGFVLADLATMPSMVLQGARDMWRLNESRISKLEANGVRNPRVRRLHAEAKGHLDRAAAALEAYDYRTYRSAAEKGWALEGKAYTEVLGSINNMIHGILFYLALLLPLAYCLERLLIASETIKKRLGWIGGIFAGSFAVLALVHPAFRFTMTPLLVLLAFVILALVVMVSVLLVGRMDRLLQQRKEGTTGRHSEQVQRGGIAVRAIDLGMSNIRRRPQRGFLTGLTVVMVTFILLSFTSMTPTISISRLTHPEGRATYRGLLARDRAWEALPNPLVDSVRRDFRLSAAGDGDGDGEATVAARGWFFSDKTGQLSQIDVTSGTPGGGGFTAVSLLCMEPTEPAVTAVDKALLRGSWFTDPDAPGVILPLHAVKQLGYGLGDVGASVWVFGQELPIVGIFDAAVFDAIRDIDGEPLTPTNFVRQEQQSAEAEADEQEPDTLIEYVHYSSDQLAIVPLKLGRRLGATLRSIAVKAGGEGDLSAHAEGYTKRSNLTILASDGRDVMLYAARDTSQISAAWQIAIPVFLGFIMILGTMLGSVYERSGEIFVYSSVGLSPRNVSSLFLAESSVYAIIGAGVGYLLGQVASKVMQATGLLSGLSLNYTAGSTVLVTVVTMLIVILSAIYPARRAYRAAIPEAEADTGSDDGDSTTETIRTYLPFVAAPGNVLAMHAYMHEYLENIQGVAVGQVAAEDLQAGAGERDGRTEPLLRFRAWLAPFDLGISHQAELRIVYRADRDVYQYHLTARHFSGDRQNWRRLTPQFILAIRKQLLMWRILTPEQVQAYADRGEQLFGPASDKHEDA